jgi:uncharacterized protein involved in type VI secretion and phage assembly
MSGRFYGKYRGVVSVNHDDLSLGRIKAHVPDVYGDDESGWAMPCAPFGGKTLGFFALPAVGAGVWIEFEHGDPDRPIWSGCWWTNAAELPAELSKTPEQKVLIKTHGGHMVLIDDGTNGGITLQTAGGQKIVLSPEGIEITNGQAVLRLTGKKVSINDDAFEVT